MGGSGGYRRLPGGSDDFSLQTDKQTLHHNIYIIIIEVTKKMHRFHGVVIDSSFFLGPLHISVGQRTN